MKSLWITFIISCAVASVIKAQPKQTSNFNENWLKAVVSIERGSDSAPLGTGFLVVTERGERILVTAAHVILQNDQGPKDESNIEDHLQYRRTDIDSAGATITDKILAPTTGTWVFSLDNDLALRKFGWSKTVSAPPGIPISKFIAKESVETGAPLLVLGFPFGLRSITHEKPIARKGIVARSDPDGIVADAFVYPGNSGGPVVYVPIVKFGESEVIRFNHNFIEDEGLVGMVISYVPYQEPAISTQTQRPRILFEENSGLCLVVGSDAILNLLRKAGFIP